MNEVTKQKLDEIKISNFSRQSPFNNWILGNTNKLIDAFGEEVFDKIMEELIVDIHGFQEFMEIIIHIMISERKVSKDNISKEMIRNYHLQKEFETTVPSAPYLFWYSKYTKYLGDDKIKILKTDIKYVTSQDLLVNIIPYTDIKSDSKEYNATVQRLVDVSKELYEVYKENISSKPDTDELNEQVIFKYTLSALFTTVGHVPANICYGLATKIVDTIDSEQ